jgi:hypothetical protein
MNIVLIILGTIGAAVCALFIIGLFSRKTYRIERSVTILKPASEVFHYIRFLKNQDHYNKWVMMDPGMKKDFSGVDGTKGFIYAWDGNNKAGAGEQEIKNIDPEKRVDMEVRFKRPFKGIARAFMETSSVIDTNNYQEATKLQWVFSSELKYPANIFLLLMNVEKTLGRDIDLSLANLKTILEK